LETGIEKIGYAKILEVAGKLFAEKGYSNVSIRDVCREASTTPPMIYYYFGSKRGLFNAVVSRKVSMQEFKAKLYEMAKHRDEIEGISSFIGAYLTSFPGSVFDPGLYIRDTAKLDSESAERISKELDEVHKIATSIIESGIKHKRFREIDAAKAADCLIGMLNHVVFQRIHFSRPVNIKGSKTFITEFFLRAMK
jgi:AcrR family transcriptional regulator